MDLKIVLFLGLLIFLNYIVWFKPSMWMKFTRFGENSSLARLPSQKIIWRFINSPSYIWYIRGLSTLALIITILIMVFWL
jgi:hypothetical protein